MSRTPFSNDEDLSADGDPSADESGQPLDDLQKIQQDRDDLFDRLARTTAEYKNSVKRMENEMEQSVQYANAALIKSLIPVIDNFERALAVDPAKADSASLLKGLQLVHDQWISVLRQQNVQEIAPKPGDPFDPLHHQALMQQESDQYKEPTVMQLMQKGYSLGDRTLRPAQVAVSKTS